MVIISSNKNHYASQYFSFLPNGQKNIPSSFQTFHFILPEGNPIKAASCTEISGLQTQPFQPNPRFVVRRRHETSPTGGSDLRLITRQRLHNRQQPRPVPVSSIKSRETIPENPAGRIRSAQHCENRE